VKISRLLCIHNSIKRALKWAGGRLVGANLFDWSAVGRAFASAAASAAAAALALAFALALASPAAGLRWQRARPSRLPARRLCV